MVLGYAELYVAVHSSARLKASIPKWHGSTGLCPINFGLTLLTERSVLPMKRTGLACEPMKARISC